MMSRLSRRHFIASGLALLYSRGSLALAEKVDKPPKRKTMPPSSGNPFEGPSGAAGGTSSNLAVVSQPGIGTGDTTLVLYDITDDIGLLGKVLWYKSVK